MKEVTKNILFFTGVILLIILISANIFIYSHDYRKKETNNTRIITINNTQPIIKENVDTFYKIQEKHWDHMPLTYTIDPTCSERQINRTRLALKKMKEETDSLVLFEEVEENPDYSFLCKEIKKAINTDLALADAMFHTNDYNTTIIVYAEINFYGQGMICGTGYPAVELHEILHTFDIGHNPLTKSIMNPYAAGSTKDCKITMMDKEYTDCLKYIYSNGEIGKGCIIENRYIEKEEELPYIDENGYYNVPGTRAYCPRPNMTAQDGICF